MLILSALSVSLFLSFLWIGVSGRPSLFPYGLPESDLTLPRDIDDVSSPELKLRTPILFNGQSYNSVYINQNGFVSFLTEIPAFVNIQFPLDYPTIAPFYSDVDTRIVGTIYYRETNGEELLERARGIWAGAFSQAATFKPADLLIVTWDSIGYFDQRSDKSNTFQLIIGSDGKESYTLFLYERIEWIQGTGKNPNLPDAKAQAGLISGNGPHFSLKGSGTDQVSNLHKRSNMGEEGVWAFHIGAVEDKIEEPDLNVDLDSSTEASSSCFTGATHCHSQAECIDYEPGFCCRCARGYYGCFTYPNLWIGTGGSVFKASQWISDVPQRITGKVRGVVNGIGLDDSDLFSYILPTDGRSYTAIAKVPERLGFDAQTLSVIGTIIGWMFSSRVKGVPNGFQLTGGSFNYTAEVSFFQTGQKVTVMQSYSGLDVFSHIKVDTRIHGATPVVPVGKAIEINDYEMQFTRVSPGILRSRSSHKYTVEGTSLDNPFNIEQTIEYKECPWAPAVLPEHETIKMKVGRNYIYYDLSQQIVRFAITSKVTPTEGEDPCKENKEKCGPHSSCVADNDSFKCICNLGYERRFNYEDPESETEECFDINECQIGTSTCDITAICTNSPGSFACTCQPGYNGNGFTCKKNFTCSDVQCGPHAECFEVSDGEPECRCLPGFFGDGLTCNEQGAYEVPPDSCEIENNCHPDAACRIDERLRKYTCQCRGGFRMEPDGYTCTPLRDHDLYTPESIPEPMCIHNLNYCRCPSGWAYDDIFVKCVKDEAETSIPAPGCESDANGCGPNAACVFQGDSYKCVCKDGFHGDGAQCLPQDFCSSHSECGEFGECAYDGGELRFVCKCREGFELGDSGRECLPKQDVGCEILKNCHPNATCVWNERKSKYGCECKAGFRSSADGVSCQEDLLGCNILQNCGKNGECGYDPLARGFRCRCKEGFVGDGYRCRSSVPCYQDRSVCDSNAECVPKQGAREWSCQCRSGFTGDGQECRAEEKRDGSFLIVTKGMSLINVPLTEDKSFPIAVEPFQTAIGIDIDCTAQVVYWSDVAGRAIKMAKFNGSERTAFLNDDIGSPEGLSVDWASGNVYWTDSSKDTVEVANLKTKQRKLLISTDLVNPRGIAVYTQRGRVFWSDWNREHPKIEYAGLDGKDREVLVGDGLALPNSLLVDPTGDLLCWADAGTHKIECIGIDGRNRRNFVTNVKYPFGLAMNSETFFWSDWETKKIESANRGTGAMGKAVDVSLGGPGKLYGIVLVPLVCPHVYSPCQHNPCGEDHMCLPSIRGSYSCLCSDASLSSGCRDAF